MFSRATNLRSEFPGADLCHLSLCVLLISTIVRVCDQLKFATSYPPRLGFYSTLDKVSNPREMLPLYGRTLTVFGENRPAGGVSTSMSSLVLQTRGICPFDRASLMHSQNVRSSFTAKPSLLSTVIYYYSTGFWRISAGPHLTADEAASSCICPMTTHHRPDIMRPKSSQTLRYHHDHSTCRKRN